MDDIEFYKMSGSGNDFILIDNRNGQMNSYHRPPFAKAICRRGMSVGADGLIIIENSNIADFKWHFLNADGSEADMCGNGARCAARFANVTGIAGPKMTFETQAGLIRAEMDHERVKIQMPDPSGLSMNETIKIGNRIESIHCVNTGVPHAVMVVPDIEAIDIDAVGPLIRHHPEFSPEGTNANFIQQRDDHSVAIRTYERGVEAETLACGTGSVAGAIVAASLFGMETPLTMITRSGLPLKISFIHHDNGFQQIYLTGDARIIYRARLEKEAPSLT
jgi:diaminopimelate epimerase